VNYEEYYKHCRNISKISDNMTLPDLEINDERIVGSIEDYQKKILDIRDSIFQDTLGWDTSDKLFTNYQNIQSLPNVIDLGNQFCQILSKEFFGCQMVFDRIECYTNIITNSPEHSSWKWHYDDCAPYRYKIMIYLSDVGIGNGGMQVLMNSNNECISYKSSRVQLGNKKESLYPGSRIPESVVENYIKNGYEAKEITGPIGTTIFFHQNILHKATIPTNELPRTCMIYNFRPYHKILKNNYFISRSDGANTGGVKDYLTSIID